MQNQAADYNVIIGLLIWAGVMFSIAWWIDRRNKQRQDRRRNARLFKYRKF